MRFRNVLLMLFFFLTIQCSNDNRVPSDLEAYLSKRLHADKVYITHNQDKTTKYGQTTSEDYLLIEMYNPKILLDIKFNERFFKNRCDELSNFLLDSIKFPADLYFNDLRLKIIENHGFLMFKSEETTIVSYKAYR